MLSNDEKRGGLVHGLLIVSGILLLEEIDEHGVSRASIYLEWEAFM